MPITNNLDFISTSAVNDITVSNFSPVPRQCSILKCSQLIVSHLPFFVFQSRVNKKANVFGNVDDESPERDRAKKKRDLNSHLRTQEPVASESRKRSTAEDTNAVATKKQKPTHAEGGRLVFVTAYISFLCDWLTLTDFV